jgi:hypothetical protein
MMQNAAKIRHTNFRVTSVVTKTGFLYNSIKSVGLFSMLLTIIKNISPKGGVAKEISM